ncbi:MAG: glycosyltransferase, partial [Cyanobacteria bacterium P01_D01_bin.123]
MQVFEQRAKADKQNTLDPTAYSYTIVIPTLNARKYLPELLPKLSPAKAIFIDSSSNDGTASYIRSAGFTVFSIERAAFNHGKTRNLCLDLCTSDFVVFMTQDARPLNDDLFTQLLFPFADKNVAATYARQIPRGNAAILERLEREFKYPDLSLNRSNPGEYLPPLAPNFLSNSCAAYRMSIFRDLGGFIETEIMGEDAIYALKAKSSGYRIKYVSDAVVIHSHSYSPIQRLQRYFDTGVYRSRSSNAHRLTAKKDMNHGLIYVRYILLRLLSEKHFRHIALFLLNSLVDFIGYSLGRQNHLLPISWRKKMSMNSAYWEQY